MPALSEARNILKQFWGYNDFRPLQSQAMEHIAAGTDTLIVIPTGGGKSILYQVPALMNEGPVLVLSPLISLMADQVDDCNARGVPAVSLNSAAADKEQRRAESLVRAGRYKVVYCSPERLDTNGFQSLAQDVQFSMVAVDEAHCCSLVSHDFRPDYGKIGASIKRFGYRPQVIALTATCTAKVKDDILKMLKLRSPSVVLSPPVRENVEFVRPECDGSIWSEMKRVAFGWDLRAGRYIVYVNSRKGCETACNILREMFSTRYEDAYSIIQVYHAGMDHKTSRYDSETGRVHERAGRTEIGERFKDGRVRLIVATSAFGMGIDVPDVRAVLNLGLPLTIEDYVQQAGRAGRDGLPSRAILLATPTDIAMAERRMMEKHPEREYYERFQTWLADRYPAGSTLTDSMETITYRVNREPEEFDDKITLPQMQTILAVFRTSGILKTMPNRNAMRVESPSIRDLRAATRRMSGDRREVAQWFLSYFDANAVNFTVVRSATVADQLTIERPLVKTIIAGLAREGLIKVERGHDVPSYEVMSDSELVDVVYERVDAQRRAAVERFEVMKRYAETGDPDIILAHFVGPDDE